MKDEVKIAEQNADNASLKVIEEMLEADKARARLRKSTFEEEVLLHKYTEDLDKNGNLRVMGPEFPKVIVKIAKEVLRRQFLDHEMVDVYIPDAHPNMEYQKYRIYPASASDPEVTIMNDFELRFKAGNAIDVSSFND